MSTHTVMPAEMGRHFKAKLMHLVIEQADACRLQGQVIEARCLIDKVLESCPDNLQAHLVSGLLYVTENADKAAGEFEQVIQHDPDNPEALFGLGVSYYQLRRYQDGLIALEKLRDITPDSQFVYRYLGLILEALGRSGGALDSYLNVLKINPHDPENHLSAGIMYAKLGFYDDAISCFQKALALDDTNKMSHVCLARALVEIHQDEAAYYHYRQALLLAPDDVDTMIFLAQLLLKTSNVDDAEQILLQAQRLNPGHAGLMSTFGRLKNIQGHSEEATAIFQSGYAEHPTNKTIAGNLLFSLNYLPQVTPEYVAQVHKQIAEEIYPPVIPSISGRIVHSSSTSKIRKIGYLSADFNGHAVSSFFEPILLHHDRSRFLPCLYYGKGVSDESTARMRKLAFQWRSTVGLSAEEVAGIMVSDGIDILVDLSGFSSLNRLDVCALRSAPIQVSWIGYPHSTGMRQIDYYLTDNLCDPVGMTDHLYAERVYRLPRIFCTYLPPLDFPQITPLTGDFCKKVTFGSFNNFAKTNEQLFLLWAEILNKVPNSRLMLKSSALAEGSSTKKRVHKLFESCGISPERIIMQVVKKSQLEHLAQYSLVDIALDTYPYHGTTTTCEALWMGVPVVTLEGSCHAARVGVSLLSTIGLGELIARSPEEYVSHAVNLAKDGHKRLNLREKLRFMMAKSPLMDAKGVTRDVESAFDRMLEQ